MTATRDLKNDRHPGTRKMTTTQDLNNDRMRPPPQGQKMTATRDLNMAATPQPENDHNPGPEHDRMRPPPQDQKMTATRNLKHDRRPGTRNMTATQDLNMTACDRNPRTGNDHYPRPEK